ncbi:GNAT family N-acetyltransferase [Gilvimarinus sp. F26214L]|uniref:GNAT family N-acetyltransferase n=1 Tax=Gilvimarinus sp. DZF01 TaxID=3461371 RepID=UPI0040459B41
MVQIVQADYSNPRHATDMAYLLNEYARDPMGGGGALPGEVTGTLAQELGKRPHAFTVLCYVNDRPAGMVNFFELFSTFAGKPLINIHDVVVVKEFRGRNLARLMLNEVEAIARKRGCCKLTLEVLEGNAPAKAVYERMGFAGYELDPAIGKAVFWQKPLAEN